MYKMNSIYGLAVLFTTNTSLYLDLESTCVLVFILCQSEHSLRPFLSVLYWNEDSLQSQWNPADIRHQNCFECQGDTLTYIHHMYYYCYYYYCEYNTQANNQSQYSIISQHIQVRDTYIVIFNHLLNEIHSISQRNPNTSLCPVWTQGHTHSASSHTCAHTHTQTVSTSSQSVPIHTVYQRNHRNLQHCF